MAAKEDLLRLFQNPTEPVSRDGVQVVPFSSEDLGKPEKRLIDFTNILKLPRHANFSLFIPFHRKIAAELINIFMNEEASFEELRFTLMDARDLVNPYLFNYCMSVALLHRTDTQGLDIPSFMENFPDKFIDSVTLHQVREKANLMSTDTINIPINFTASDLDEEHRLAFWREDIGLNLHHWHWHLVYPADGDMKIVNKDRRGELFYYMHQQILARYNFERLCASLKRVTRFADWRKPIPEAYFSKLNSEIAGRAYPPRVANQIIRDLDRVHEKVKADVHQLEEWRDRIYTSIYLGKVQTKSGKVLSLTGPDGIDILGNMIEPSELSPNRALYGDLHSFGHLFIAYIHDPDYRYLENFGVMGDSSTAMRDPIFYRWHAFIDDIFQKYKATLPGYTESEIEFPGITVESCEILTECESPNVLSTFWKQSEVDLSRGLDFAPAGPKLVRFTHLQHKQFKYEIKVKNSGVGRRGTCRIFIAPAVNEAGTKWSFQDQRTLFVELDKFEINVQPGNNIFRRRSDQSSVTIPFEKTFRNLDANRPAEGTEALEQFNFCGCGWPQHLLIPKGTPEGKDSHLFVMISNYEDDRVDRDINVPCGDASSYCGIRNSKYPDKRSMGYPFDRVPRDKVNTLEDFLMPNMRVQDVTIRFTNTKEFFPTTTLTKRSQYR